jgi:hypothetical protein
LGKVRVAGNKPPSKGVPSGPLTGKEKKGGEKKERVKARGSLYTNLRNQSFPFKKVVFINRAYGPRSKKNQYNVCPSRSKEVVIVEANQWYSTCSDAFGSIEGQF